MKKDSSTQSWKAMLGGDSFVKAGWVHGLKAHVFKNPTGDRWLVMGKVNQSTNYYIILTTIL